MTIIEGEGIRAFGYLALYHKLEIQANGPKGMRWRVPPSPTVRQLIGSTTRNNKKLLEEYRQWLIKEGYMEETK